MHVYNLNELHDDDDTRKPVIQGPGARGIMSVGTRAKMCFCFL